MPTVQYEKMVLDGVQGRNGVVAVSSLSIQKSWRDGFVDFQPYGRRGDAVNANLNCAAVDCPSIIEAIVEAALDADYSVKEKLEEALRAALVKLQNSNSPDLQDDISELYLPPRF